MTVLQFIWRNLDHYRWPFLGIALVQFIIGALGFLIPITLAEFTKQDITSHQLTTLLAIITGLYLAGLGFQWLGRYYGEGLAFQFGNHIRTKYFRQLEQLPASTLQKHHSGFVLSLINKIGDGLDQIMFELPWMAAGGLAVIGLFFFFTAKESLLLAIINLVMLIAFVALGAILAQRMIPLAATQNQRRATLMGTYADFISNLTTIKKLGIQKFAEQQLATHTAALQHQIMRVQRFHANRWLFLHGLYGVIFIGTISFMLWQISHGYATASVLILFVSAYATIKGLIERLSENIKSYLEMGAYIGQLTSITGQQPAISPSSPTSWQTITFHNVTFAHPGSSQTITIPTFQLQPGDKICITGPSGQGKSTFINLLTNQLTANSGQRLVDQQPYPSTPPAFFSHHMAVISQETDLFHISIRQNLTLGTPTADDTLVDLLRQCGMGEWLAKLEAGLDTVVGEKGVSLSAGQKQRLNILRALLLDRDIYILDEPTAHLDDATEQTILKLLATKLAKKTIIIITHRPALQSLCNQEYQMRNHQLVQQ
jgi:ABC-type bacteriocin/lantibiotic exporter with double-glycine peptidase domain